MHIHRTRRDLPVVVREVSPGGLGLVCEESNGPVAPDAQVTVQFVAGGVELELPGRVAWRRDDAFGVQLRLEIAPQRHRRAYARWVVDLLCAGEPRPC